MTLMVAVTSQSQRLLAMVAAAGGVVVVVGGKTHSYHYHYEADLRRRTMAHATCWRAEQLADPAAAAMVAG